MSRRRSKSGKPAKNRGMFPNIINSPSFRYYSKYVSEYRHQYEEILKHYSSSKAKTIGCSAFDSLVSTPTYFVENLLNGTPDKEESWIPSSPSSEYNDETSQKSPPMTSNVASVPDALRGSSNHSASPKSHQLLPSTPTPPPSTLPIPSPLSTSPISEPHESRYARDTAPNHGTSKRGGALPGNNPSDLPTDYSVGRPQQYRSISHYAIDRLCPSPRTTTSSSNGTGSPSDGERINRDTTPTPTPSPTAITNAPEFASFPVEENPVPSGSEKYG